MRAGISKRLLSLVFVAGAASPLVVPAATAEAATHRFKVVTQFQPPAAGQIEVIAVVFSAHFSGKTAPLHPITDVKLPGASRPHNYGLLYGTQLTRVAGNIATYVWLTMALKPLGAKSSHDQPLVGESLTVTPIANGGGSLHPSSQELTINNADESELVQFASVLRTDGVTNFSPSAFDPESVPTYNDFNWKLNPLPSSASSIWNAVGGLIENPQLNVSTVVHSIDAILHARFLSGSTSSGPTVTGHLFTGTLPDTIDYALTPVGGIDAFRLVETDGAPVSSHSVQTGWTCTNSSTNTVVCKGPLITAGFTGILNYTGTAAPNVSVAGSTNGGVTFGASAGMTLPTPSTSGSLRVSCPSSVTQGQSIQITITVGTPSAPVKVTWTLPNGSTVLHTAMPNSTNPTSESDAIGTSQAGPWKVLASGQGQTATCPAITVNAR